MAIRSKKYTISLLILAVAVTCAAVHAERTDAQQEAAAAGSLYRGGTVVIDAGHGGEDGGAVSVSGQVESNINLQIALRLDQLFGLYGVNTVLLRTEDVSLHEDGAVTLREKKVSDLHRRVELTQQVNGAVLISIHQNTYPGSSSHGAQVFYGAADGSEALARRMKETLLCLADPENRREVSPVPEHVYLMKHVTCPAVLVECGFLSNPQEEQKLLSDEYQIRLSAALCSAYLQESRE